MLRGCHFKKVKARVIIIANNGYTKPVILTMLISLFMMSIILIYDIRLLESMIGIVYSSERNVRKSLTLQILAKGQGIAGEAHLLLCSIGDQTISGVSL